MALPSLFELAFFYANNLQAFAKEGARVTATDINGEKLKELDGVQGKSQMLAWGRHLLDN